MRILAFVTDGFGDALGRQGGIAHYNRNVLQCLCERADVTEVVALPRHMPDAATDLPDKLDYDTSGLGGKVRYGFAVLRILAADRKFDIIICSHIHLLPFAFLAKLVTGSPILLFVYGLEVWSPTPHRFANYLVRTVHSVISIRRATTERFVSWAHFDRERCFLLENAIHLEHYGAGPKNSSLLRKYGLEGKTVLLTVGRLAESNKGFDETLELLPQLVSSIPDVAYLIVGSGPGEARLREKAAALGLADRVVFAGGVSEQDKAEHFRLGDVFVMAGRGWDFDRYPLRFVFLEAMACGIPVAAARPDSEEELTGAIADATVFVDPGDPASIERGILECLRREKVVAAPDLSDYSYPVFRRKLHGIIDQMKGGRPSAT